ncbi:MAG: SprT family zinc-dependent metalloprotease [Ignavibacteriota bacterium]
MILNPESYSITRRQVRNARISINHEMQIKITIPLWYREREVMQLLKEKQPWIEKQLIHFEKEKKNVILPRDGEILFLGESIIPGFDCTDPKQLHNFYISRAREEFGMWTLRLAEEHGFTFSKLTIRNQKTRWGSCSKKKNISLNWKLIKTPPHVMEYVILHELTHTQYFDHSLSFWKRLEEVCPDYKIALNWLKKHGRYL